MGLYFVTIFRSFIVGLIDDLIYPAAIRLIIRCFAGMFSRLLVDQRQMPGRRPYVQTSVPLIGRRPTPMRRVQSDR